MATVVITPEMQRANAEALLGKDPGKFRDPGQRWTVKRYAEIQRLLKQAEADKPVTILNLNPFPLKINGGVFFPEEIAPCPPGKPYTIHVIRDTRWGHKDLGCDAQNMMQMEPVPAIPLVLAAEYIREYVQQDGGFGGVLCYVGDHDPATMKKGATIRVPEVAYSDTRRVLRGGSRARLPRDADGHSQEAQHLHRAAAPVGQHLVRERLATHERQRYASRSGAAGSRGRAHPGITSLGHAGQHAHRKAAGTVPQLRAIPKAGAILCVNCHHVFNVVRPTKIRASPMARSRWIA